MKILKNTVIVSTVLLGVSQAFAGPYDGTYQFRVTKNLGPCSIQPGTVIIQDGKISGMLISLGQKFKVTGKVKDNGKAKGKIIGSAGRGFFSGDFTDGTNTGKWSARGGCSGEYTIR